MNKIRYILDLSNVTPPDDLPRKLMLLHDEARKTAETGKKRRKRIIIAAAVVSAVLAAVLGAYAVNRYVIPRGDADGTDGAVIPPGDDAYAAFTDVYENDEAYSALRAVIGSTDYTGPAVTYDESFSDSCIRFFGTDDVMKVLRTVYPLASGFYRAELLSSTYPRPGLQASGAGNRVVILGTYMRGSFEYLLTVKLGADGLPDGLDGADRLIFTDDGSVYASSESAFIAVLDRAKIYRIRFEMGTPVIYGCEKASTLSSAMKELDSTRLRVPFTYACDVSRLGYTEFSTEPAGGTRVIGDFSEGAANAVSPVCFSRSLYTDDTGLRSKLEIIYSFPGTEWFFPYLTYEENGDYVVIGDRLTFYDGFRLDGAGTVNGLYYDPMNCDSPYLSLSAVMPHNLCKYRFRDGEVGSAQIGFDEFTALLKEYGDGEKKIYGVYRIPYMTDPDMHAPYFDLRGDLMPFCDNPEALSDRGLFEPAFFEERGLYFPKAYGDAPDSTVNVSVRFSDVLTVGEGTVQKETRSGVTYTRYTAEAYRICGIFVTDLDGDVVGLLDNGAILFFNGQNGRDTRLTVISEEGEVVFCGAHDQPCDMNGTYPYYNTSLGIRAGTVVSMMPRSALPVSVSDGDDGSVTVQMAPAGVFGGLRFRSGVPCEWVKYDDPRFLGTAPQLSPGVLTYSKGRFTGGDVRGGAPLVSMTVTRLYTGKIEITSYEE